jgi:hypothetical protein
VERRGASNDFELLDLSQRADQLLRKAVGKILVVRVAGVVDQREDGDCLAQRNLTTIAMGNELVGEQDHHGCGQHADDRTIDLPAGVLSYRMRAVHVSFALQAFRCQFVEPRKHHRERKAQYDCDDDDAHRPRRHIE